MVRNAIAGLAVAGILLLAVSGCGGDDSSIGKQEYDQKLEVVCNQGLKEREDFLRELNKKFEARGEKASKEFQTENIRKLIALYQATTEEIADIGLPEEGEKKAEELVQTREQAAAKIQADPLGSIEASPVIFKKTNEIAEDLEAKSCAT
jgi:hypothetical protein